jgi:hypothetical protein
MTLPVGRRSIPEHASCIKSLRVAAQPATNLVQEAFLWGLWHDQDGCHNHRQRCAE